MARFALPPFMPAGGVIQQGRWADHGEWDDEQIMFPSDPWEDEDHLLLQDDDKLELQDGDDLIL